MRVVALVADLMDRTRLTGALGAVEFVDEAAQCAGADIAVVDLARQADAVTGVRNVAPAARIVAFGPHVDGPAQDAARAAGADTVLPRSRFFHDVAAAVLGGT
jgi:hypothetical protein